MKKTSRLFNIFIVILFIFIIFSVSYYFASRTKTVEKMSNITDYVDVIYYINLDNRPDRNEEFLKEMEKLNIPKDKIVRIPAIYNKERGHVGCALSHIKTIKQFIEANEYKTCIIFEDDFEFVQDPDYISDMFETLHESNLDYDVCMLAGNIYESEPVPEHPFFKKATSIFTTSGYILSKKFAPTLLKNFTEASGKLDTSYDERAQYKDTDPDKYGYGYDGEYAIDQYWTSLQKTNNWYIFYPKLGKQRSSYSDIMQNTVNYNR